MVSLVSFLMSSLNLSSTGVNHWCRLLCTVQMYGTSNWQAYRTVQYRCSLYSKDVQYRSSLYSKGVQNWLSLTCPGPRPPPKRIAPSPFWDRNWGARVLRDLETEVFRCSGAETIRNYEKTVQWLMLPSQWGEKRRASPVCPANIFQILETHYQWSMIVSCVKFYCDMTYYC